MKTLPLTRGYTALVDDEDYEGVSRWKWGYMPSASGYTGYAARWETRNGQRRTIYLHRQIMQAASGQQVDHHNGNGLDNRRTNLRLCSQSENFANRHVLPKRSVPYRGVYPARRGMPWKAQIKVRGKQKHLGQFLTPEEAAHAYDRAAHEAFGEFARLNFPKE